MPPSETMSTARPDGGMQYEYRSVSKSAIACMVFAIMGLLSFFSGFLLLMPALGILFGLLALKNFRRYEGELTGRPVALVGLVVSAICLLGATGYHSYVYATELPDGYERMYFSDLKPKKADGNMPFSGRSVELHGKKVFVKGYVRPSDRRTNLKQFILVGDFNSCCFGGNPDITDIVAVKITTEDTVDYSWTLRRIGGTFVLHDRKLAVKGEEDIPGIYYELQADHVK